MGFSAAAPSAEALRVWEAVRDARDAVVARLREAHRTGTVLAGRDLDAVARELLRERGLAEAFVHRTGHSIDIDLHGSGPHLDSYETDDDRQLLPGVGFSVEPGVYLGGRFGMRSEINVVLGGGGPEVTPREPQTGLITR
jgi:Xaa-Pro aminopeptidase